MSDNNGICKYVHQTMQGDYKCELHSTYDEKVYCDGNPKDCPDYDESTKRVKNGPPEGLNATQIVDKRSKPTIICLCGSTRFMQTFFEIGWQETLKGKIVLSVGVCKHADKDGRHGAEALGQDVADRLDELHLRKIDLADEVMILNVNGYIGKSTLKELEYAVFKNKEIKFLEKLPEIENKEMPK